MAEQADISEAKPTDLVSLLALYPLAFPEEDLTGLVQALTQEGGPVLSLVARTQVDVIGHVLFTRFEEGAGALLGPLAVHPEYQRGGIGTRLVREGFARLQAEGTRQVLVLGDPGYYGRFGFQAERQVLPPYELPDAWAEAWQSHCLGDAGALTPGKIALPAPWMRPELWLP